MSEGAFSGQYFKYFVFHIVKEAIQDGHIDEREERGHHQSSDRYNCKGRKPLKTDGPFEGDGQHADAGADGGHKDGPRSHPDASLNRLGNALAFCPCLLDEINKQDGILHYQPGKQNHSHKGDLGLLFSDDKHGPNGPYE